MLAHTGMRRGKALALRWSDLDGTKLHIQRTISVGYEGGPRINTPKTAGSDRIIILDQQSLNLLREQKVYSNSIYARRH